MNKTSPKPKKIAFVINNLGSGGAERVVSSLANEFCSTYTVLIITLEKAQPFYSLNKSIELLHCTETISPSKSIFQALNTNLGILRKLAGLLKKSKVDICLGFMTTPNVLAVLAAKWVNIPVIISERNNPFLEDKIVPKFWKVLRTLTYPRTDYLVVQTETIKKYYTQKVSDKKLVIIPNPINPDFEQSIKQERRNIVLNVGRLSEQKNQDLLIRAFSNVRPKNWELHIVGEGGKRNSLERLIQKLNLSDYVKLIGQVKTIQSYYESSKIFAFTSIYEGFPNALIEAMHFGLACVSTDCPSGPSELIEDGQNGFLVPVNGQELLEIRLSTLMADESLTTKFGLAAKNSAAKFDIKSISSQWSALIDSLPKK